MSNPPTPPQEMSFYGYLVKLREEAAHLKDEIQKQLVIVGHCDKSPTTYCGRSIKAAPHPWTAADGTHCKGFDTMEALEGSYCAHWGSPVSHTTM
jgi:hypothetical protein